MYINFVFYYLATYFNIYYFELCFLKNDRKSTHMYILLKNISVVSNVAGTAADRISQTLKNHHKEMLTRE